MFYTINSSPLLDIVQVKFYASNYQTCTVPSTKKVNITVTQREIVAELAFDCFRMDLRI